MRALLLPLLILILVGCSVRAQGGTTIEPAVRIAFDSTPGTLYSIEASEDMVRWERVAEIYAESARTAYFAERTGRKKFFRTAIASASANWIAGVWSGKVFQALDGTSTFTAIATMDAVARRYSLSLTLPCSGRLKFRSQDATRAVFDLEVTSGNCSDGTVTFQRLTPTLISYQWVHKDGANVAVSFGLLEKQP